jgi:hypothetical protein
MGHVAPCLLASGDAERANSVSRFNAAVMKRAQASGKLGFLASPVTGSGVACDRIRQLFLASLHRKHPHPPRSVWVYYAAGARA